MTPKELHAVLQAKAIDTVRFGWMAAKRDLPEDILQGLLKPAIDLTIAAVSQYYSEHPEYLALAGTPICVRCHEPIQSLQVGADPSRQGDPEVIKVAWPCGHFQ